MNRTHVASGKTSEAAPTVAGERALHEPALSLPAEASRSRRSWFDLNDASEGELARLAGELRGLRFLVAELRAGGAS